MKQQFLFAETEFRPGQDDIVRGAVLSPDQIYRFQLWRTWSRKPKVLFIMHNPSTADHMQDDPTIRRCIGFAKSWGAGGFYVGNLSPYRCTKPADLRNDPDPGYAEYMQKQAIREMKAQCEITVYAHGVPWDRHWISRCNYYDGYYLRLTKAGHPEHPLYLPGNLTPQKFPIPS